MIFLHKIREIETNQRQIVFPNTDARIGGAKIDFGDCRHWVVIGQLSGVAAKLREIKKRRKIKRDWLNEN